jgi:phage terminase small subunit
VTLRQQRFVAEYLIDLNATQAAIRAGYSKRNADQIGPRLVGKSRVTAAIKEAQVAQLARINLTADRALLELERVAFSDIRRFFTDSGELRPLDDLTADEGAVVASVDVAKSEDTPDTIHKLKLWDKLKALEMLAKHFGLLNPKDGHHGKTEIVVMTPWSDSTQAI